MLDFERNDRIRMFIGELFILPVSTREKRCDENNKSDLIYTCGFSRIYPHILDGRHAIKTTVAWIYMYEQSSI